MDLICFDKTGTLTQDGMFLKGILPSKGGFFSDQILQTKNIEKMFESIHL